MVKSERYTCNLCNRMFSSASSIWNHRTKIHKVKKDYQDNPSIILDNPLIINNEPLEIESVKTYNCKHCNKEFKYFQNRWRHEKICKNQEQKNTIENNGIINNININNTNNGTINNIIINNFNEDNIKYISNEFMKRILTKLANGRNDENLKTAIPHLVHNMKFNKYHKENNNAHIPNIKSKIAIKYNDNKWEYVKKEKLLTELHNRAVEVLQNWMKDNKDLLTEKMLDGFKDYTHVSHDFKKKIIHEEINLLGYLYYKNHIEVEIDK